MTAIKHFFFILLLLVFNECLNLPVDDDKDNYTVIDSVFIYLVDFESMETVRITEGENPLFVPNSNKIVYRYYDKIYTINYDKTEKKETALANGMDIHLLYKMAISNNGDFLIYSSKINELFNLFKVDIDGRNIINLTSSDNNWENDPMLSSADNFIVYRDTDYSENTQGYSFIDINGNNYKKLIYNKYGYYSAVLTPDDKSLAVFQKNQEGSSIYYVNIENPSTIDSIYLDGVSLSGMPVISDDSKLYYSSDRQNLYSLDLVTKQVKQIYTGFIGNNYVFSPDFNKVLVGDKELHLIDLEMNTIDILFTYLDGNIEDYSFSATAERAVFITAFHDEF